METQEIICRLCLKICNNFRALEGNIKDFLDKLLPNINLAAVQKPVVCANCEETLKECFDFKMMLFSARDNLIIYNNLFANSKDALELDLAHLRNESGTDVPAEHDLCGICTSPVNNCTSVSHYSGRGDVMLEKMVEQCLPELFSKGHIELCEKWIRAAGRNNFVPSESAKVCSNHFSKNDYCKIFGQRLLVKNAIPTNCIVLPNQENT